jgi:nucleoid DNA-binding protein
MGKISIYDFSQVLFEKTGLEQKNAKAFLSAVFDVIKDGVKRDKLVKIKGLGSFKIVDVDARESVNVNTGERVLIDGHSKISFVPDATMKELVNKPFSSFETVVVNDGVVFDDIEGGEVKEIPVIEETLVIEETPSIEEPVSVLSEDAPSSVEDAPVLNEDTPASVEEPIADDHMVEFVDIEQLSIDESSGAEALEMSACDETGGITDETEGSQENETVDEEEEHTSHRWLWLLLLIIACGLSGLSGYYIGKTEFRSADNNPAVAQDSLQLKEIPIVASSVDDTLTNESVASDDDMISRDSEFVSGISSKLDKTTAKQEGQESVKKESVKKPIATIPASYLQYDKMDARVRLGAYYIVGTAQVVKVKPGDTVERISRRYLGPDLSCYLEVYNGMKASTPLKVGQEIKIPKLEWKKNVKKRLGMQ